METSDKKFTKITIGFLLIIAMFIGLLVTAYVILRPKLTDQDVYIDSSVEISGVYIIVKPKTDIKEIEIEYEVYTSDDKIIKNDILIKENLYENKTYKYDLNLTAKELLTSSYVKYKIKSGKK